MERLIGVEEARGRLGQLVESVADGGDEVHLTKGGRPLAVLIGQDTYARLRTAAARAELAGRVADARQRVAQGGVDPAVLDDALVSISHRA